MTSTSNDKEITKWNTETQSKLWEANARKRVYGSLCDLFTRSDSGGEKEMRRKKESSEVRREHVYW
jgi:hypothetical protein